MADQAFYDELQNIKSQVEAFDSILDSGQVSGREAENVQMQRDGAYNRGLEMSRAGFKPSGADQLRMLGQGAAMGFGEEIEAGIRAPFSDQSYTDIRDDIRGGISRYREGYPVDSLALEAIGGLAVPGVGTAGLVGKAPNLVGQLMRTFGVGVGMGALGGAGYSEADTTAGMLLDTSVGAGIGGGLSTALMALPIAGKYASQAYNKLKQESPDRANQIIGELMQETGWTESKIRKALDDLGPEGTLADLDDNLLGRLIASRQKSPEAVTLIDDAYTGRQAGARDRIIGELEDASGFGAGDYQKIARPSDPRVFGDQGGKVAKKQAEVANQMYGALQGSTVQNTGRVNSVLNHERVKPIVREVMKDMNIASDRIEDVLDSDVIPLSFIDKVKKRIDDQSQSATQAGEKSAAGMWGGLAKELRESSDEFVPDYALARQDYGAKQGLLDAGELGRGVQKIRDESLELMPGRLAGMSHNEQQMFKMGALSDIAEDVNAGGTKGTGFPASRIFAPNDPQKEARLSLLAGKKKDQLTGALEREAQFHKTYAMTEPSAGSRTAIFEAASTQADEAADAAGVVMNAMSGDFPALARAIQSSGVMSREVATEVARKLTNKSLTSFDLNKMFKAGEIDQTTLEMLQKIMKGQIMSQGALNPAAQGVLAQ
tara:strand:- start:53 stop:2029 length:1977 start_codon:yes stop_codon:yes gene_type:complete